MAFLHAPTVWMCIPMEHAAKFPYYPADVKQHENISPGGEEWIQKQHPPK